jgi:CBS domain-containing protein
MATTDAGRAFGIDTAGEHVSTNVPRARPEERVAEIRTTLWGKRYDSASDIVVCEDDRPVGLLTIERLLAAPEEASAFRASSISRTRWGLRPRLWSCAVFPWGFPWDGSSSGS